MSFTLGHNDFVWLLYCQM